MLSPFLFRLFQDDAATEADAGPLRKKARISQQQERPAVITLSQDALSSQLARGTQQYSGPGLVQTSEHQVHLKYTPMGNND